MPNIFGDSAPRTWTDPSTDVVYDAATMQPLPTVGDDLGELPGRSTELADLDGDTAADDFAALLGIDPEDD